MGSHVYAEVGTCVQVLPSEETEMKGLLHGLSSAYLVCMKGILRVLEAACTCSLEAGLGESCGGARGKGILLGGPEDGGHPRLDHFTQLLARLEAVVSWVLAHLERSGNNTPDWLTSTPD